MWRWGVALLLVVIALLVGGLGTTSHPEEPGVIKEGATTVNSNLRALGWLKSVQNPDGSFGTGAYLSRGMETAFVLGVASASCPEPAADTVLEPAYRYLAQLCQEDGSFGTKEDKLPSTIVLLALAAARDRKAGELRAGRTYLEMLNPTVFAHDSHATVSAAYERPHPIELLSAASAAFSAKDPRILERIRSLILSKQREDGSWGPFPGPLGSEQDRTILGTIYAMRALRLVQAGLDEEKPRTRSSTPTATLRERH